MGETFFIEGILHPQGEKRPPTRRAPEKIKRGGTFEPSPGENFAPNPLKGEEEPPLQEREGRFQKEKLQRTFLGQKRDPSPKKKALKIQREASNTRGEKLSGAKPSKKY